MHWLIACIVMGVVRDELERHSEKRYEGFRASDSK